VDVTVLDDALYEGDETLNLDLSGEVNGTLVDAQGSGTIAEDDPMPQITLDDPVVGEADGTMTFTISLDAVAGVDVSADYATSDNTATDGADYTGTSGTATITAGDTSTTVDVTVLDDALYEGDETLNLDLSGEVNGTLVDAQGQGTITEDEAVPGVSIAGDSAPEGNSGSGTLTFVVSLTQASASDVAVDYATTDGSATAGSDYTAASGTIVLSAGETSATVDVTFAGDVIFEPSETFTVDLSNLTGTATLDVDSATGTITNDDKGPATVTGKARKTTKTVKAKGLLEPAESGNKVTVTLARFKGGSWVKVATKKVTVTGLGDRDADTKLDAQYVASFPRPAKGKYRFKVKFAGDADTKAANKTILFVI
jgi:chitinase